MWNSLCAPSSIDVEESSMKFKTSIPSRKAGALCLTLAAAFWLVPSPAALSYDELWHVPYQSLGLTEQQAEKIDQFESDWKRRYDQLSPQLKSLKQELLRLLADPRSDPLE